MGSVGPSEVTRRCSTGASFCLDRGWTTGAGGAGGLTVIAAAGRIVGDSGPGMYSFRPPIAATMAGVATIATKATAKIMSCITETSSEQSEQLDSMRTQYRARART